MSAHVDISALHTALDGARVTKGLSWRELARQIGVSASTMTRLGDGSSPSVNAFMAMAGWLRMPAENFLVDHVTAQHGPEWATQLVLLLRAREDLDGEDVEVLHELIQVAVRGLTMRRTKSQPE